MPRAAVNPAAAKIFPAVAVPRRNGRDDAHIQDSQAIPANAAPAAR